MLGRWFLRSCLSLAVISTSGLSGFSEVQNVSGKFAGGDVDLYWTRKLFDQTEYDFGPVVRGATYRQVIEIKNPFNEPVHLSRISRDLHLGKWKEPQKRRIEPGKSLPIQISIKTIWGRGNTFTFDFDRPEYGRNQVLIKWQLRNNFVCDPGHIDLGSFRRGTPASHSVKLMYLGNPDWKITSAICPHKGIAVSLKEIQRKPAQQGLTRTDYELRITVRSDIDLGTLDTFVLVKSSDTKIKKLKVYVEGKALKNPKQSTKK